MAVYFKLDDKGQPVQEPDMATWSAWFQKADRRVARTIVSADVTVLTIFTGVYERDLEPGEMPVLFETRVFGGVLSGTVICVATREEALEAQSRQVYWCQIANKQDYGITESQIGGNP